MVCPHETSMSIDLTAALDSEGREQSWRSDGRREMWVKVAEGVVKKEEEGDEAEDRKEGS